MFPQQAESPAPTSNAPTELTQAQFMDLLARSQSASSTSSTPKLDLAALLGGSNASAADNATSSSSGSGFAIGKSKITRPITAFTHPESELVSQSTVAEEEPESPMMPGDFAAKPKTASKGKGKNSTRLYCPREGCGSLILLEGAAEWVDVEGADELLPQDPSSPFTSDTYPYTSSTSTPPRSSASRPTWHLTGLPMCFENIGFTRTAAGGSAITADPTAGDATTGEGANGVETKPAKAVKYMICAECDLGPLGWCFEGGTEGWLGAGRVRYGQ